MWPELVLVAIELITRRLQVIESFALDGRCAIAYGATPDDYSAPGSLRSSLTACHIYQLATDLKGRQRSP